MQKRTLRFAFVAAAALVSACTTVHKPLTIQQQGSFAVGGTVVTAPGTFDPIQQGAYTPAGPDSAGQTLHGDHAYVFYQVPAHARKLPLVFWHGHGQSGKTWETTPDGREGFQTIFLRRRFPVYVIDQPRRGRGSADFRSYVLCQPFGAVLGQELVSDLRKQRRKRGHAVQGRRVDLM